MMMNTEECLIKRKGLITYTYILLSNVILKFCFILYCFVMFLLSSNEGNGNEVKDA